jgi:nucleoside-diphosphate-sugar epimerase
LPVHELHEMIAQSTRHLERLQRASVLITGATGWFGTLLLDYLCTADDVLGIGIRITALSRDPAVFVDRFPSFRGDPRITWVKGDVREVSGVSQNFSHVIHAATDSTARRGNLSAEALFDTIIEGTRRVLRCVRGNCEGFLLVSSGAIYGPAVSGVVRFLDGQPGGPDPASPRSAYAEGKRAAEQLCAIAAAAGAPARIARCFAFVGPHMPFDQHFAIGNFIADAVHGRPIRIKSDGKPQRSYLYTGDLIRALLSILLDGAAGRAYNVGSDQALTIGELAERVNRVVGGCGVVVGGAASDPTDRYVPDTTRLRSELNFTPTISLDTAIARTAAWYRDMAGRSMPS